MEIVKGQNFRVFATVDGAKKAIAFARSCSLHVSQTLEDSSTKDTTGMWQEQEVTGLAWDGSVDALYAVGSDDTAALSGNEVLDMVIAAGTVEVEFDCTSGTKNRVIQAGKKYSGKAFFNDYNSTHGNRANSTYTAQFTGTGALTSGTSTAETE